ncbi:hypothetical protein K474DRAFT_1712989 [Panus rudis PR-1116 ss-1]|nr:hypothetical protein K474DRAFT_1712989 [Panus rudis PR-1116 ss-1]
MALTLKREVSFPPQLWCYSNQENFIWEHDMRPRPPPTSGKHLELKLSKLIESGRSGHVYEVDVLGVSSDVNVPTTSPDFPLPFSASSLPNQTGCANGGVVPRAYGFFTTDLFLTCMQSMDSACPPHG